MTTGMRQLLQVVSSLLLVVASSTANASSSVARGQEVNANIAPMIAIDVDTMEASWSSNDTQRELAAPAVRVRSNTLYYAFQETSATGALVSVACTSEGSACTSSSAATTPAAREFTTHLSLAIDYQTVDVSRTRVEIIHTFIVGAL
jgi:hypothetical protein